MAKSFKYKNNNYLDSTGIVHNRGLLSTLLTTILEDITYLKNRCVYSTSETEIGTFNGKKLYRKCWFYTGFPTFNNNHYSFNHNISNIDRVKDIYGSIWDTVNQQYFPLQYVTTANVNVMLNCTKTKIDIEQNVYGSNRLRDYWVCLEYTKN